MKKLMLLTLLAVPAVHGFDRDCQQSNRTDYTYAFVVTMPEGVTMCRVYLTSEEKNFVGQVLASFDDATEVTRDFYVNQIKNKYSSDNSRETALRRVVRDFGGSQKTGTIARPTRTVGDIRSMLAGKLKDIGTEQAAF